MKRFEMLANFCLSKYNCKIASFPPTQVINPVDSSPCHESQLHLHNIDVTDAPLPPPIILQKTLRDLDSAMLSENTMMDFGYDVSNRKFKRSVAEYRSQVDKMNGLLKDISGMADNNAQKYTKNGQYKRKNRQDNHSNSNNLDDNLSMLLSLPWQHSKSLSNQSIPTKQYYQRNVSLDSLSIEFVQKKLSQNQFRKAKRSTSGDDVLKKLSRSSESVVPSSGPNGATIDGSMPGPDGIKPIRVATDDPLNILTTVQYQNLLKTGHVGATGSSIIDVDQAADDIGRKDDKPQSSNSDHTTRQQSVQSLIQTTKPSFLQKATIANQNSVPVVGGGGSVTMATTSRHSKTTSTRQVGRHVSGIAQAIAVIALMGYIAAYAIGFGPGESDLCTINFSV